MTEKYQKVGDVAGLRPGHRRMQHERTEVLLDDVFKNRVDKLPAMSL